MQKMIIILAAVAGMLQTSCKPDDPGAPPAQPVDCSAIDSRFTSRVLPIIQNSCTAAGCHAAGSANGPGALTNYTQISNAAVAIKNAVASGAMPKNSSLTAEQ